jgi:Flp pilus assembly protein TadB
MTAEKPTIQKAKISGLRAHVSRIYEKFADKISQLHPARPVKSSLAGKSGNRFEKKHRRKKSIIELFADLVGKLGYEDSPRMLNGRVLRGVSVFMTILSAAFVTIVLINHKPFSALLTFLVVCWTIVFIGVYLLTLLVLFVYLDVRMYQRVKQIEESLPDFLQLASANISAGMTVDRALWYAVRPKFGILAKEMEDVAKSTIAGEDLEKALIKLGARYDSRMLKETINLVVEGISSGGEMAELLNKLSINIKETQLMRKEISASVTTYAIFIGVAAIIAAPILFALSTELLIIIQNIFSHINLDKSVGASTMFSFNFSGDTISIATFQNFAVLTLCISSFFSASIISVIRKGSVKDGLKMIPVFMIVSVILYYLATALFKSLMGGLF